MQLLLVIWSKQEDNINKLTEESTSLHSTMTKALQLLSVFSSGHEKQVSPAYLLSSQGYNGPEGASL